MRASDPMRVMIVDDSHEMRQLIRQTLEPLTTDVVECSDGDEAVDAYSRHLPDWTVMDFRMQRVDGLTAIRELRARWPSSRILLLTAFESRAVQQSALQLGAACCLCKDDLWSLASLLGAPGVPSGLFGAAIESPGPAMPL